jgi:hypothetical protein
VVEDERNKLVVKYGTTDEKTNLVKVTDENMSDFLGDMKSILDQDFELDFDSIDLDQLDKIEISPVDIDQLIRVGVLKEQEAI